MNTSEFQQKILQTGKPVIVDFWAPWCVPCRVTKPVLEKLATEYAENVEFLAVNADETSDVLNQFHVGGIPTVLALRDGNVVGRVTGAQNEIGYRALFEALVSGKEVETSLPAFDRMLRLTAGTLIAIIGVSTSHWFVLGIGGMIAFLGVYDRCPIWAAITRQFKKTGTN
ncbi:MAG TPA: thioredoxin domain-containing protein [Anaerolineales bacterium]|nr:thioredoxin domain-containing protein [Anaerolineales bacterium]